jgi:hypothetical protein
MGTRALSCDRGCILGLCLGKNEVTWVHTQGVDSPSLGSMGALKMLDDPISTPMESHVSWNKEQKARGVRPRMWHASPKICKGSQAHRFMGTLVCKGACQFNGCTSL